MVVVDGPWGSGQPALVVQYVTEEERRFFWREQADAAGRMARCMDDAEAGNRIALVEPGGLAGRTGHQVLRQAGGNHVDQPPTGHPLPGPARDQVGRVVRVEGQTGTSRLAERQRRTAGEASSHSVSQRRVELSLRVARSPSPSRRANPPRRAPNGRGLEPEVGPRPVCASRLAALTTTVPTMWSWIRHI